MGRTVALLCADCTGAGVGSLPLPDTPVPLAAVAGAAQELDVVGVVGHTAARVGDHVVELDVHVRTALDAAAPVACGDLDLHPLRYRARVGNAAQVVVIVALQ